LPISLLLSLLLTLGRLTDDNELKALQASGQSPHALLVPPALMALLVSLVLTGLAFGPQPWAARRLKQVAVELIQKNIIGDVKAKTFYEGVMGLTLYAESVTRSEPWRNVLLFNATDVRGQWLTLSARGRMVASAQAQSAVEFQLEEGESHADVSAPSESPIRSVEKQPYDLVQFTRARLLGGIGDAVSRGNGLKFSREESTPADLYRDLRRAEEEGESAVEKAVSFHWRVAQLFTPFALALIGFALSALLKAQGRGVSALMTLGAYVSYYVVGRVLTQWGERSAVPAIFAGHGVNLIFLALGLIALSRVFRRGIA
jgi:lipopolysaccharide export system permease protein